MHGVSGDAADASRCGRHSRLGSNGFGFVAQSSADAADALGCAGSGMGLWGDGVSLDCVSPALAVRVDTHLLLVAYFLLLSTCCSLLAYYLLLTYLLLTVARGHACRAARRTAAAAAPHRAAQLVRLHSTAERAGK